MSFLCSGSITNVNLQPATIDLALMVDVYHEFSYPWEMMRSICAAVRPGGQSCIRGVSRRRSRCPDQSRPQNDRRSGAKGNGRSAAGLGGDAPHSAASAHHRFPAQITSRGRHRRSIRRRDGPGPSAPEVELVLQVPAVGLDCLNANLQFLRDIARGLPFTNSAEHLELADA